MWKDDKYWFNMMLSDSFFKGYFLFKSDQETILSYELKQVEKLD